MEKRANWLFWTLLVLFAAIYLGVRVPWITGDPGVPSMWEYGYNATDEGYYLSGGKEKFLWGLFVDLPRNEAFTYGFSAGTHWLSYLSHLCFGLSTWTWRIPFLLVFLLGALAMFWHLAKRTGAAAAFALCMAVSLTPMVVAYERTASNDALIGAILVLAYVCGAGGTWRRIVAAGLLSGTIVLVKPSVWVLLPVVAAGIAQERELRTCAGKIAAFAGVAVACAFAWKLLVALSVLPDAARANVSVWEIVRKTTTHYPLPPIFDFASHFRGLSSFPRDPSIQMLGVIAPFISSVPAAMAVRCMWRRRWNGRLLLFLAVPAYVAAVSVMNTIYTHYFLPVVVLLPIVFSAIAQELDDDEASAPALTWRAAAPLIVLTGALCAVGLIWLSSGSSAPATLQSFYARVYNLPAKNVWGMTAPLMLVFSAALMAGLFCLRGFRANLLTVLEWALVSFATASVVFAALPAVQFAAWIKKPAADFFAPLSVSLVVSVFFVVFAFGPRRRLPWRRLVAVGVPLSILACFLATPVWRTAFRELSARGTDFHARAARELAALLPADAIVLGERSNQMLMSLPVRTATTFATGSNPIPVIESILASEPDAKLYALADSQHAYNLQHFREHADVYRLTPLKQFKMPSFGAGVPADVYLCRIDVRKKAASP